MSEPPNKPKISRFEDLQAWQLSRELTREVYKWTTNGKVSKDFGFSNQIQRASVSIMSKITEGFERFSRKEFHQYLAISRASCAEVRSLLYVALDVGYLAQPEFDRLMALAQSVSNVVSALKISVSGPRNSST